VIDQDPHDVGPVSLDSAVRAASRVGTRLGVSRWYRITRDHVLAYRSATSANSRSDDCASELAEPVPQHMVLSMCPRLVPDVFSIDGARYALNYGTDSVVFPGPTSVDDEVMLDATLTSALARQDAVELRFQFVVTVRDRTQPACIATNIFLVYWP
jgi:hypothetical protein